MKREFRTITQEEAAKRYAHALTRAVEEGDCMIWQGAMHTGHPVMQTSVGTISVRRIALISMGREPKGKMRASCSCGNERCIAPKHIIARVHKDCIKMGMQQMPGAAKTLRAIRIAKKKEETAKLTPEMLAILRSDDRPQITVLAKQWGVRRQALHEALSGKTHKPRAASPWDGLKLGLLRS